MTCEDWKMHVSEAQFETDTDHALEAISEARRYRVDVMTYCNTDLISFVVSFETTSVTSRLDTSTTAKQHGKYKQVLWSTVHYQVYDSYRSRPIKVSIIHKIDWR